MTRIEKLRTMLLSLGYTEKDILKFTLHRFEKLEPMFVNMQCKDSKKIKEIFEQFHRRYQLYILGKNFPNSSGALKMNQLIEFLEEYDKKFNLDWCEIDFKEFTAKFLYL